MSTLTSLGFLALLALTTSANSASVTDPTLEDPHILTLAGSCAACHGTNGLSVGGTPVLAGLDRGYFIERMQEYQKQITSTEVMPQQTRGLTSEEIFQLGAYFAAQSRSFPRPLQHSLKLRSHTKQGE